MEKLVLDALWSKILGIFPSKTQVITALADKQDALIAGSGISIQGNVISTAVTEETVNIEVSSEVSGFDPEGLVVNVYYNDAATPSTTVTLDANGTGTLIVPQDYKYRMVFPYVEGCAEVPDVVHYSTLQERSVEIEYVEASAVSERVRISLKKRTAAEDTKFPNATVNVTIGGSTTAYTTDSDGVAELYVPYGTSYTVSAPAVEGWRTPTSQTFTASKTVRGVTLKYLYVTSALLIVDSDGTEWIPDDFYAAVQSGVKQNSDAKMVEFVTDDLIDANGCFALDIDMFATGNGILNSIKWASSNILLYSIPENGGNSSQLYYYDGLTASKLIQNEGDEREVDTPFVDTCLSLSRIFEDGVVHEGFGGSIGQWSIVWSNRAAFDDIVATVRTNVVVTLSTMTSYKWSITQRASNRIWTWTTVVDGFAGKTESWISIPFFAFLNS